jgi:hypothetical protein
MPGKSFLALPLSLLATLGLHRGRTQTTPEQTFWIWFQNNQDALFDFEKDQEKVFDRLGTELHKVHPSLTFEFGPKTDDRREFVISADGIREAFPKVESLYAAAPSLPRWKFVKFRPRRKPNDISYGGVYVKHETVTVQAARAGEKADIVVFIPGYNEQERNAYLAIAFLVLDEALGEYDVETRIGKIQVKPISPNAGPTHSLEELPRIVDAMFAH